MDLSKLDLTKSANEGAWITLKHPASGEELTAKIKVAGKDSTKYNQITDDFRRKALDEMKSVKTITQRIEMAEEHANQLLAECTLDWKDIVLDGVNLEFTKENVSMVYKRFFWIKEQVDLAIADRANFLIP